nr:5-hydroxytryptamine receptor-like [Dermatophagoides farinae]
MPNLTTVINNITANLLIESQLFLPTSMKTSPSFAQIIDVSTISGNNYNNNNTINPLIPSDNDLSDNGHNNDDSYLNPNLKITLIVLLSLMIVCTVIGNILVCLSVILVRKLRHPSNYLLVSLAISDLCVAILVMPLALQYELSQSWRLSNGICDLWVSFDVTACTSSILNLCTISIDRYLAIKKPLTYGVRRTTKRILSFIVAVWIASCLISIPPVLILGNEHGTPEQPICEVSQNLGYQLYATLGAFYIPLFVMIVMYYKIYVAAKRVVDAELRDQRPSCSSSMTMRTSNTSSKLNRFYSMRKLTKKSQRQQIKYFDSMGKPFTSSSPSTSSKTAVQLLDKNQNYLQQSSSPNDNDNSTTQNNNKSNHIKSKCGKKSNYNRESSKQRRKRQKFYHKCCCCCCSRNDNYFECDDELSKQNMLQNSNEIPAATTTTTTVITPTAAMMVNSDGTTTTSSTVMLTTKAPITTANTASKLYGDNITCYSNHKHLNGHQKSLTTTATQQKSSKQTNVLLLSSSSASSSSTNFQSGFRRNRRRSIINSGHNINNDGSGGSMLISGSTTLAMKQRASNALRERKASVTLGIIMTAFTVCWLPFFILAVLRPFSASVMQIPRYVTSIALWLGYVNSMLNPIIYVTFHQDFRRAFKYLLCFQCRSMGTRLREEAYLSQYGKCNLNNQQQNRQHRINVEKFDDQQRSCKIMVHNDNVESLSSNIIAINEHNDDDDDNNNNNNKMNIKNEQSFNIDSLSTLPPSPPQSSSSSSIVLQTDFPVITCLNLQKPLTTMETMVTTTTTTTNARMIAITNIDMNEDDDDDDDENSSQNEQV